MTPATAATPGSPACSGAPCAAIAGIIANATAISVAAANAATVKSTMAAFATSTRVRRVSHVSSVVMLRDANSAPTNEAPSAQPMMAKTPAVPLSRSLNRAR